MLLKPVVGRVARPLQRRFSTLYRVDAIEARWSGGGEVRAEIVSVPSIGSMLLKH